PDIGARRVHGCGPTEMIAETRRLLRDLGVPDGSIVAESFARPNGKVSLNGAPRGNELDRAVARGADASPAATVLENRETSITFTRSNKSAPVRPDQTVLEAAEAVVVAINHDCRAGICGQCKVKRLAGRVVMEAEDALTAADLANDIILSCQARCIGQVVIEA
ncbi:MAG: flavin reductase family protein, partial [Isosphaeraceae bacterium]